MSGLLNITYLRSVWLRQNMTTSLDCKLNKVKSWSRQCLKFLCGCLMGKLITLNYTIQILARYESSSSTETYQQSNRFQILNCSFIQMENNCWSSQSMIKLQHLLLTLVSPLLKLCKKQQKAVSPLDGCGSLKCVHQSLLTHYAMQPTIIKIDICCRTHNRRDTENSINQHRTIFGFRKILMFTHDTIWAGIHYSNTTSIPWHQNMLIAIIINQPNHLMFMSRKQSTL